MRNVELVLLISGIAILLYSIVVDVKGQGWQTVNLLVLCGAMMVVDAGLLALGLLTRK